jgi:hypothetical protein
MNMAAVRSLGLARIRRHSVLAAVAAAMLATVAGFWPSRGAAATDAVTPAFGVQFHGMWSDYTDAERARVLDELKAAQVKWIRLDVGWSMLQPDGQDSYSPWGVGFVDRVIDMAANRGLKVLVTLWLTPAWANHARGERTLPDDPADYARAVGWAAQHWAGKVQAWEIWNEPNDNDSLTGASPAAYTRLLRAAYPAIHAGNPDATVVFGGPSGTDAQWIEQAYAAGAHGYFDAMAVHPYQAVADEPPSAPDNGTRYRMAHVAAIHRLMVANGDGAKPIWFTEFGWSSHSNAGIDLRKGSNNWRRGVSEERQAEYLVETLKLIPKKWPYVTKAFWYDSHDRQGEGVQNGNYGLLRRDLSPKPAYTAVANYLAGRSDQADQGADAPSAPTDPRPAPLHRSAHYP